MDIIPAILAITEEDYKRAVGDINSNKDLFSGLVQIDIADGIFVNNKTVYWEPIEKYSLDLEKDAHLMVKEPASFVTRLSGLGFKRITLHLEIENISHIIEIIKERDMEVGLAVNPETSLEDLEPYLDKLDVVLIMGVHPGKQGQEFIPGVLNKIEKAVKVRFERGLSFLIGVDGGVSSDNVKLIKDAGADYVVVGSHIFEGDIEQNVQKLNQEINSD
jgi:ribulose-phosphate 3-epimerase